MLSIILIGLSIGMVMFLIASGLSLAFGMLGVANVAHGAFYMMGAYIAAEAIARSGSFILALAAAPIAVGLLAAAIEIGLLRLIYQRAHEQQFLLTFGLLLVLEEVARAVWGVDYRRVDAPALLDGSVQVFGEVLSTYRLFVTGVGLALSVALITSIERTKLGMVLRAAMTHPTMTRALGIRVSRYRTLVFAVGGALAGFGGAVAAPLLPVQVNMGSTVLLQSFMIVIIGGIGNVVGAVVASIALGLLQAFGETYAPDWVLIATYTLMAAVLLGRPQGLFTRSAGRRA